MVQGLMRAEGKAVSIAQLCHWFGVSRSTFYYRAERRRSPALDQALVELVGRLIEKNPDYGVLRWFPSWTGQGTEPASRWRVDGGEGVSAVDGEAEG